MSELNLPEGFSRIAVKKIKQLKNQDDYISLKSDCNIVTMFFRSQTCTVDKDGRVTWFELIRFR